MRTIPGRQGDTCEERERTRVLKGDPSPDFTLSLFYILAMNACLGYFASTDQSALHEGGKCNAVRI